MMRAPQPIPTELRQETLHASRLAIGTVETEGLWCLPEDFAAQALPTLTKKVVRHALAWA